MHRIDHLATDRDKAPWKRFALIALIAIWLGSGIIGRDPWKPDEPVYFGILYNMLTLGGDAWWIPQVGGLALTGESPFIHWINALVTWPVSKLLPLHEAARVSSVMWAALAISALAFAAKRWSAGHISYLTAIIFIGCLGLYDRAHSYVPEVATLAALSIAIYGLSGLTSASNRSTAILSLAIVLAFMANGALGAMLVIAPLIVLSFAPVLSMHRVALVRALFFGGFVSILLGAMFLLRSPESAKAWLSAGAGIVLLGDRARFSPQTSLINLLWFAWPAWPIALWTLILRWRGFAGGWQRAEIIVPVSFLATSFLWLAFAAEPRTLHSLFFLPPLVLLASFGVDTIRRTWYAMIDWFGILVLGMVAIFAALLSSALYFRWPEPLFVWAQKFVPNFVATPPWIGFGIATLAFLVWIALVQPAHQHSRRALINWAGCVTFVWVAGQSLLIAPADYRSSHRSLFVALNQSWPQSGCVNSIDIPASHIAMLQYTVNRTVLPVTSPADARCAHLLIARNRGATLIATPGYETVFSGSRPGDRAEKIELLRRTSTVVGPGENKA